MKEWKKPCMEVVVLDERDVIATSTQVDNQNVSMDNAELNDQTGKSIWGR